MNSSYHLHFKPPFYQNKSQKDASTSRDTHLMVQQFGLLPLLRTFHDLLLVHFEGFAHETKQSKSKKKKAVQD